ncbi:MAG TPA: putative sulfate exporter family transporter [Tissierellaceae bacterium]
MLVDILPGVVVSIIVAITSMKLSSFIPGNLISAAVFALILGMLVNPAIRNNNKFNKGMKFVSKKILKFAIILMGATLSFSQVLEVGKYSLIVMTFTLLTAFGGGYYLGKAFNMNWKLSSLISAGTGICGASAVAAIAPTIEADSKDVAYAISATFIFDIIMVILFPIAGKYFNMSDLGFGLWAGTAVNDTSSVVAAGYAFSDAAGQYAIIVKLTRTLSIVPVVLIFSYINEKIKIKENTSDIAHEKINIKNIFPWFILMFLVVVGINSLGFISDALRGDISKISKFLMTTSLAAIGLDTNFKEVSKSGFLPMLHGFIISALVVVVSFVVQNFMGQM